MGAQYRSLAKQAKSFAFEDKWRTWIEVFPTLVLFVAIQWSLFQPLPIWLATILSILLGLLVMRVFTFYHDCMHGAIFTDSALGRGLLKIFSVYMVYSPKAWRDRHHTHHMSNSQLNDASIAGQFPLFTTHAYSELKESDKKLYRLFRHPLMLLVGYVPYFIMSAWESFKLEPKKYWSVPVWLLLHACAYVFVGFVFGLNTLLFALLIPLWIATVVGSYLFYAQHTFEGAIHNTNEDWDYYSSALFSSSMFTMPKALHWITGNIGYHHVHHVNHKIPFYKLPEAMANIPDLQNPITTSWHWRDIKRNLQLDLWDTEKNKMVSFKEAS